MGNLSRPGDPRRMSSEKSDPIVTSSAGMGKTGSLSSKPSGHSLLEAQQRSRSEKSTKANSAAQSADGAADNNLSPGAPTGPTGNGREATGAAGSIPGSAASTGHSTLATELVGQGSENSTGTGAMTQAWTSTSEATADAAAGGMTLGDASGDVGGREELHGRSRRLLDVFGESLRHVDNLLNAR